MNAPVGRDVLARNTAWAVFGYFVSFGIPVLMTPYVVSKLGLPQYGVWVALSVLASWLGRFDLGIWSALAREVSERRARGDAEGLRTLGATWLLYDLLISSALCAAAVLAAPPLLRLFAIDPSVAGPSLWALMTIQAALSSVMRHFTYTLNGLQRVDRSQQVGLIAAPFWAAGMAAVLELGMGLTGLALNNVLFALLQIGVLAVLLRREGCPIALLPRSFRGRDLRGLLSTGLKLEVAGVLGAVLRSDRLALGPLGFPPASVALYQIGSTVADRLGAGVITLSSAVLPAASDLAARGERERLRTLLHRSTKYHALAATGLLGFAALFAPELLLLWMGRPLPDSAAILRIMSLGAWACTVCAPAQALAVALGRPGLATLAAASALGGGLLLYMAGGRSYDEPGLAGAVSGGLLLSQVLFMIGFRGSLEFRWREFVGNALLKPLAAGLPPAAVYAGWRLLSPQVPVADGRLSALLVLAPAFLAAAALSWAAARATGALDAYDMDLLKSLGRRAPA